MSTDRTVTDADLHAYIDDQLSKEDRASVAEWLKHDDEAAAMTMEWQAQNAAIRAAFASHERSLPTDERLLAALKSPDMRRGSRRARRFGWPLRIAAAFVLFFSGAVAGQFVPLIPRAAGSLATAHMAAMPQQAQSAYAIYATEVRHPVEVGANEQVHLAKWLGKRLDYPFVVPDLTGVGFNFVGGRLVPVYEKPGALLMYEDDKGQRITVLIGRNPQNRTTSFRQASAGGIETFYWIDGPIGYAVSGEVSREALQKIAQECYRQFPT